MARRRISTDAQATTPVRRAHGASHRSGQYASQGFWGGSVSRGKRGCVGPYVGLLGLGRTNRKPYYNLNFDPNDSVLTAPLAADEGTALTLFQVRDDRLGTDSGHHFVLRQKPERSLDGRRVQPQRRSDADPSRNRSRQTGSPSPTTTPWFVRLAWDPKANYTNSDMTPGDRRAILTERSTHIDLTSGRTRHQPESQKGRGKPGARGAVVRFSLGADRFEYHRNDIARWRGIVTGRDQHE